RNFTRHQTKKAPQPMKRIAMKTCSTAMSASIWAPWTETSIGIAQDHQCCKPVLISSIPSNLGGVSGSAREVGDDRSRSGLFFEDVRRAPHAQARQDQRRRERPEDGRLAGMRRGLLPA